MSTLSDIRLPSLYNPSKESKEVSRENAFKKFKQNCKDFHTFFCSYIIYQLGGSRISDKKNLYGDLQESENDTWTTSIISERNVVKILLHFGEEGSLALTLQKNSGTEDTPVWKENLFSSHPHQKEDLIVLEIKMMIETIEMHYFKKR